MGYASFCILDKILISNLSNQNLLITILKENILRNQIISYKESLVHKFTIRVWQTAREKLNSYCQSLIQLFSVCFKGIYVVFKYELNLSTVLETLLFVCVHAHIYLYYLYLQDCQMHVEYCPNGLGKLRRLSSQSVVVQQPMIP